jgi:hypothetical protein
LSGTLAHKKSKKIRTVEESKPKSWFFDIYEETEAQQDYTVSEWTMTQSATVLDISDDESKAQASSDRGKENIPPNDVIVPSGTSTSSTAAKIPGSRKDMMTDEPRTPLGHLNAADYYPDGLDASSVILVQDNTADLTNASTNQGVADVVNPSELTFEPEAVTIAAAFGDAVDFSSLLASSQPALDSQNPELTCAKSGDTTVPDDIEIWESESAKDEREEAADSIFAV